MRSDLQSNIVHAVYLFGDNMERWGMGGQAKEIRGEPNAIGVPTLEAPGKPWTNKDYDRAIPTIVAALQKAQDAKQSIIVIPEDGLGTGLAELDTRAPKIFAKLIELIQQLVDNKKLNGA